MNTLKQSFKFCCFLRKGICDKLYLVASIHSFILLQMPAIAWSRMCVHVKTFPFKHWDSKTQQWKYLNCWFSFLKKKKWKTAHPYAMLPPWLNYTLSTMKKSIRILDIFHSLFMKTPVHLPEVSPQFRWGQFALCTNQLFIALKKIGPLCNESPAWEIQRSVPGSQLREHLNCASLKY